MAAGAAPSLALLHLDEASRWSGGYGGVEVGGGAVMRGFGGRMRNISTVWLLALADYGIAEAPYCVTAWMYDR